MESFDWQRKYGDFVVTVVRPCHGALWRACQRLEYRVFVESGYVEPNTEQRLLDYEPYVHAEFVATLSRNSTTRGVVAAMRVIHGGKKKRMRHGIFPTIDSAQKLAVATPIVKELLRMDPAEIVDLASMAVTRERRSSKAAVATISGVLARVSALPRVRYAIAAIDTTFFEKLRRHSLPWRALGPSTMYWGSMTTAAIIKIGEIPRRFPQPESRSGEGRGSA